MEVKIIEKAQMKMRLDRLVIQQGRLPDKMSSSLKKEEMHAMIRHGLEYVLKSKESDVALDEDIDSIIAKCDSRTRLEESERLKLGEQSLRSFGVDNLPSTSSTNSVYQFEGEDYRKKQKSAAANNANILQAHTQELPKLERKVNYSINAYYREALREGKAKTSHQLNGLKLKDFQFYPPRLFELLDQEIYLHLQREQHTAESAEEQLKIDNARPLTEEEETEKANLFPLGFPNWSGQDFLSFIQANEKFGRDDIDSIKVSIEGKSPEEVMEYTAVFWERCYELQSLNRIIEKIERGEQILAKRQLKLQAEKST